MRRLTSFLIVAVVAGVPLHATPAALADRVIHRATVGSTDQPLPPPENDQNFSLVAIQHEDGTTQGQWHDELEGGSFVQIEVTCLAVDGNDAWISGIIVQASPDLADLIGAPAITQVRDNGTSPHDPADQISFTNVDDIDCLDKPELALFDLPTGEVKVQ